MSNGPDSLPLPPDDRSVKFAVDEQWRFILHNWRRGWAAEESLETVETYLESQRVRIFVDSEVDGTFDWKSDWLSANALHGHNMDLVRNRRAHNDSLKAYWSEWGARNGTHFQNVSLEALRSIVLIDGAAILAALAVLTGQIGDPRDAAIIAAKITVAASVASLLLMATGHTLLWARYAEISETVRAALIGQPRHTRLYAIGCYVRRHMNPTVGWANGLIYGSIVVFGLGATISALVLLYV